MTEQTAEIHTLLTEIKTGWSGVSTLPAEIKTLREGTDKLVTDLKDVRRQLAVRQGALSPRRHARLQPKRCFGFDCAQLSAMPLSPPTHSFH